MCDTYLQIMLTFADNGNSSIQQSGNNSLIQRTMDSYTSNNSTSRNNFTSSNTQRENNTGNTASNSRNNSTLPLLPRPATTINRNLSQSNLNNSGTNSDNPIVCSCNAPAIMLTVRKDGPNKGN